MRPHPLLALTVAMLAAACAHRQPASPATAGTDSPPADAGAARADGPPVAPARVCVADEAGRRAATATPSWAGTYDPHAPVDPAVLNWTVPGVGCVAYPGPAVPREPCGAAGETLPVVARVLCQQ